MAVDALGRAGLLAVGALADSDGPTRPLDQILDLFEECNDQDTRARADADLVAIDSAVIDRASALQEAVSEVLDQHQFDVLDKLKIHALLVQDHLPRLREACRRDLGLTED